MFFVCLSSAECVADDGLSLGRRCLITRPLLTYLVAHDSHLHGIARKVQVHQAFLDANRDRTVGGKRRRQIIEFGLVTPNVDVTVQSHRNVVEIVMRLQWCAISISTCSYGRGRHILFLDVDDCPLLGLFGLTDSVSNRHSADDCEDADTQTNFHECPPKIIEAIQLPRVALLSPSLELYRSILLSTPCHPLDTLPTSGREVAQKGKRTERIQRWLSRWNCVTAICTPRPIVRWSRSASGKLPSTSPGVRKHSFFPRKSPPAQAE